MDKGVMVIRDGILPRGDAAQVDYVALNSKNDWNRNPYTFIPARGEQIEDFGVDGNLVLNTNLYKEMRLSWDRSARVWRMMTRPAAGPKSLSGASVW